MKSNRLVTGIAGFFLFLSIVLVFVWFLPKANTSQIKEITFEETTQKLKKGEIKEVAFKQSSVEIFDLNGNKLLTTKSSDTIREVLLTEIREFNKNYPNAPIKYSEEPTQSGWGWIVLINAVPFFLLLSVALAVTVYTVRTLSRNKG